MHKPGGSFLLDKKKEKGVSMERMFEKECPRSGEKGRPLQDALVRMKNETVEERRCIAFGFSVCRFSVCVYWHCALTLVKGSPKGIHKY